MAHSYEGDTCKVCGLNKASTTEATISFEDVGNRTEFNTSLQVWEQNGIKVTNNKSKSTNDVADYYDPARFYAHSSVTVEAPANITKIIFDCNSSSYANALKNSIGSSALISSDKVTVELDGTSNTFTVEELTAQVRMDAITVVFGETVQACQHTNTTIDNEVVPTCTASGLTEGKHCSDCGEIIVEQQTVPALGHDWIDATYENPKTCDRCGLTEGEKLPSEEVCEHSYTSVVTAPTCTEAGFTTYTCTLCADTYIADTVAALGHDWIDATYENPKTCDRCGLTEGEKLPEVDSGENEMPDENETPEENDKDHTKCEAESILQRILTAIINFFRKLFGLPEKCVCGDEL